MSGLKLALPATATVLAPRPPIADGTPAEAISAYRKLVDG